MCNARLATFSFFSNPFFLLSSWAKQTLGSASRLRGGMCQGACHLWIMLCPSLTWRNSSVWKIDVRHTSYRWRDMATFSAITPSFGVLSSSSPNDCTVFSFPHHLSFVLSFSLSSLSSLPYISSCCMWNSCTWRGIHSEIDQSHETSCRKAMTRIPSPFAITIGVMLSSININVDSSGRAVLFFSLQMATLADDSSHLWSKSDSCHCEHWRKKL